MAQPNRIIARDSDVTVVLIVILIPLQLSMITIDSRAPVLTLKCKYRKSNDVFQFINGKNDCKIFDLQIRKQEELFCYPAMRCLIEY